MELEKKGLREGVLRSMVEEGIYDTVTEARFETQLALERRARKI